VVEKRVLGRRCLLVWEVARGQGKVHAYASRNGTLRAPGNLGVHEPRDDGGEMALRRLLRRFKLRVISRTVYVIRFVVCRVKQPQQAIAIKGIHHVIGDIVDIVDIVVFFHVLLLLIDVCCRSALPFSRFYLRRQEERRRVRVRELRMRKRERCYHFNFQAERGK
jgi:hypothetical protein